MPRKLRALRADLQGAGFAIDHQAGSHQVWKHPLLPGIGATLAGSDGTDARPYQEREVREALRRAQAAREQQQGGTA